MDSTTAQGEPPSYRQMEAELIRNFRTASTQVQRLYSERRNMWDGTETYIMYDRCTTNMLIAENSLRSMSSSGVANGLRVEHELAVAAAVTKNAGVDVSAQLEFAREHIADLFDATLLYVSDKDSSHLDTPGLMEGDG